MIKPSSKLLLLLLLALPNLAQAQFNYLTNNGTITITSYTGLGGAVTIPGTITGLPVTSIGEYAFNQSAGLTSVTVGPNVTSIGQLAFYFCTNLTSATIPGSVTNIGEGPFWNCQSLAVISVSPSNLYYSSSNGVLFNKSQTKLIQYPSGIGGSYTIPGSVTNVGWAFVGNTLAEISVNSTNLYYSSTNGVLFNKNQTTLVAYPGSKGGNYTVPLTVIAIAGYAFEYSASVNTVTIDSNVTNIGLYAFYDCVNLTAISVSASNLYYSSLNGVLFDKIQTTLIQYPSGIAGNYIIPGTVTTIEHGAFGDSFGLSGVVIPNSVTSIGANAFYSCSSLASITIGNGVTNIGPNAFYYCSSLTSVVIPDSVTSIEAYAFYYCPSLAMVKIGSSVATIGLAAFGFCQNLTYVCFEGNKPIDGGSIFYYDTSLSTICYVNGAAGWGAAYSGIATAQCADCMGNPPQLAIIPSGANVLLKWRANFTGFTLQSMTNLSSLGGWTTVSPPPVIFSGNNVVTNPISSGQKYYRLMHP